MRDEIRAAGGKNPIPSLAITGGKSVRTTESGGPKGFDGGRRISDRKHHLLVETKRKIWGLAVLTARSTGWDGTIEVFERAVGKMP